MNHKLENLGSTNSEPDWVKYRCERCDFVFYLHSEHVGLDPDPFTAWIKSDDLGSELMWRQVFDCDRTLIEFVLER